MIMQLLKSATKANHDRVEDLAYSNKIMDGSITLEQYADLILKQYYFHKKIEPQLQKVFSEKEANRLEINKRKKTHLLKYDMLELALEEEMLDFEKLDSINISTPEEALGTMYVLEGSTLGGAVIKKRLRNNPEISKISGFNYYGCYGEATGDFWKKFVMQATIMANTEEKQQIIVKKAVETFHFFEKILTVGIVQLKPQQETV